MIRKGSLGQRLRVRLATARGSEVDELDRVAGVFGGAANVPEKPDQVSVGADDWEGEERIKSV